MVKWQTAMKKYYVAETSIASDCFGATTITELACELCEPRFFREFWRNFGSALSRLRTSVELVIAQFYCIIELVTDPWTKKSTRYGSIIGKICVDMSRIVPTPPNETPGSTVIFGDENKNKNKTKYNNKNNKTEPVSRGATKMNAIGRYDVNVGMIVFNMCIFRL